MKFVARHYTLPAQPLATSATGTVVRAADLALYASAGALIEQAQWQAAQIVQRAREEAAAEVALLRQQAHNADQARLAADESQRWAVAHQLETSYQVLRQQLTRSLQPILDQALAQALQQLALPLDAAARLGAVTAALAQCVPHSAGATLWVSGADVSCLPALGELPWAVEISAELAAGHCSLVGSSGAWQCDFTTLLTRVVAPLAPAPDPG
jgi:type III secretion protein L